MYNINWNTVSWAVFIGLLVLFGNYAPGCTEKKSEPPVVIEEPEGTAEFRVWFKKEQARCATQNGFLEYEAKFSLATCYVPDVETGTKIWYSSKWDGLK